MNLIPAALTAWRDERSLDDALKHHDRTALAALITAILAGAVKYLGGTKYAALTGFFDPDTLGAIGMLAAGLLAGFGHWAARGAIAGSAAAPAADVASPGVAGAPGRSPAGPQGPLDSPVGGRPADAAAAVEVRPVGGAGLDATQYTPG